MEESSESAIHLQILTILPKSCVHKPIDVCVCIRRELYIYCYISFPQIVTFASVEHNLKAFYQ